MNFQLSTSGEASARRICSSVSDHIHASFISRHYLFCMHNYTVSTSLLVEHPQPSVPPATIDGFMMPKHTYGEAVSRANSGNGVRLTLSF